MNQLWSQQMSSSQQHYSKLLNSLLNLWYYSNLFSFMLCYLQYSEQFNWKMWYQQYLQHSIKFNLLLYQLYYSMKSDCRHCCRSCQLQNLNSLYQLRLRLYCHWWLSWYYYQLSYWLSWFDCSSGLYHQCYQYLSQNFKSQCLLKLYCY